MTNKIGFWALLSIVIGSQVGSGVFMLPAVLAPYGTFSLVGWVLSATGAIALALVFSILSSKLPRTGGPHTYVQEAFGKHIAFFIGWGYWVVSWVSTVAVIVASIGYLSPFIGTQHPLVYLSLQLLLLLSIMLINLRGVELAGKAEFVLALFKFIPLLILPVCALYFFDINNFSISSSISELPTSTILGQVSMLTMWGFIGVESGTTPAGSVDSPGRTIPKALIVGTISVALLYFINSVGIMGLLPRTVLENSPAPYVEATKVIFGGNWHLVVSLIASLVCIGTLNAWVLTSGQIMLGLSEDKLMPSFFAKKNASGAPAFAIITSCTGLALLLLLTTNENIAKQLTSIIDFSVTAFLFVYLACCLACVKLCITATKNKIKSYMWIPIFIGIAFCLFVISESSIESLGISSLFILSGLPIYLFWYIKQR